MTAFQRSVAIIIIAASFSSVPAVAQPPDPSAKPTLLQIMRQLNEDLCEMDAGIMRTDFERIRGAAQAIADHPPIPANQRRAIQRALGESMSGFVHLDREVHAQASSIADAAKREDMAEILRRHSTLMDSCVSCHEAFRDSLKGLPVLKGR